MLKPCKCLGLMRGASIVLKNTEQQSLQQKPHFIDQDSHFHHLCLSISCENGDVGFVGHSTISFRG